MAAASASSASTVTGSLFPLIFRPTVYRCIRCLCAWPSWTRCPPTAVNPERLRVQRASCTAKAVEQPDLQLLSGLLPQVPEASGNAEVRQTFDLRHRFRAFPDS